MRVARLRMTVAGDDSGFALVLALIFLATVSLLVLVPLNYAETSQRSTQRLHLARNTQYAAQSALDRVVDAMRRRPDQGTAYQGSPGAQACPNPSGATWGLTGIAPNDIASNGIHVSVTCRGLIPAGGLSSLQRTVVFQVACASGDCSAGQVLLRASYTYYDQVGAPGVGLVTENWSAVY
jgi:Tfp pilus assembly protein PilX